MDSSDLAKKIVPYLLKELEPYVILLFGSFVNGTLRNDSDIDIAFLSEKEISEYHLFTTGQILAGKIGREVDLIDLRKASTVFKAQILGKGMVVYLGDERKFNEFRIRALKEYFILNDERAPIFEAIKRRGRIYG